LVCALAYVKWKIATHVPAVAVAGPIAASLVSVFPTLSVAVMFVQLAAEKLMTYALGRGVEYQDMPLLRQIVRESASSNYRFSSLVMSIVTSDPFQLNMKESAELTRAAR